MPIKTKPVFVLVGRCADSPNEKFSLVGRVGVCEGCGDWYSELSGLSLGKCRREWTRKQFCGPQVCCRDSSKDLTQKQRRCWKRCCKDGEAGAAWDAHETCLRCPQPLPHEWLSPYTCAHIVPWRDFLSVLWWKESRVRQSSGVFLEATQQRAKMHTTPYRRFFETRLEPRRISSTARQPSLYTCPCWFSTASLD